MIHKKVLLLLIVIGIVFPLVSSAHYIVGYANDALDGTDSEDHTIMMWNPAIGLGDNLIGSIGVNGGSGQEAMYLLDCELLANGCSVGDNLTVQVIDNGDSYISYSRNVTVTGAGFDFVENITLNSPPGVATNFPLDLEYIRGDPANLTCSFLDLDGPEGDLNLWTNFTGTWQENESHSVGPGDLTNVFSKTLSEGEYLWACEAVDNLSVSTFTSNRTFTVDNTYPVMGEIYFNDSSVCGPSMVEVICNSVDNYGIQEVVLNVLSQTNNYNLTLGSIGGGNYSSNVAVNESGDWDFTCFSKDYANNTNSSFSSLYAASGYPELKVNSSRINFSNTDPIEGAGVNVSAVIENEGCVASTNFNVSFFKDSPSWGNQMGNNFTVSIPSFSEMVVNLTYSAWIGLNNIFVFADSLLEIFEENEADNFASGSITVTLWQEFYGNVSAVKVLRNDNNLTSWTIEENVGGNIFVTDSEAEINWLALNPIGKNLTGQEKIDDFSDIDNLLGTEAFVDSVSNEYLDGGVVKYNSDFLVNQKNIPGVPVINSTNNQNFVTGILWDSSDDSNGEYDQTEKEDLVFVAKVKSGEVGEYGIYDYEIRVPVELRDYDSSETSTIYFYHDLV